MIELRNIYKTFHSTGTHALRGAYLELRRGEIHAVFGENGAGKSTLMHILAGFQRADSGKIIIDGGEKRFSYPADALAMGISMVTQYPQFCPRLRVWEACILGAEARRGPFLLKAASREAVSRLSREWGFDLPVEAPVETLDAAGRHKAAALAALLRKSRVVIFDEPTAVLNQTEKERFFALAGQLADAGITSVIVSHNINETLAPAKRATVLRDGVTEGVFERQDFDVDRIIDLMFGGERRTVRAAPESTVKPIAEAAGERSKTRLKVENLSVSEAGHPVVRSVSMELKGGAVYGLAGVREGGAETLLLTLAGFITPVAGSVTIGGSDAGTSAGAKNSPLGFRENGGVYLGIDGGYSASAFDRELSIGDNLLIHAHRRFSDPHRVFSAFGLLDGRRIRKWLLSLLRRAGIEKPLSAKFGSLSGGMRQRLLVTRELSENSSLIIMSEPGMGLDTRRRRELFRLLRGAADAGKAVLLFLSDLNDLLEVSDEIFVMTKGRISLNLQRDTLKNAEPAAVMPLINRAIAGMNA
ncbi:MAG: ATP-binding cassette domain-containing protein [Spirochaetaceae bacterium]|nr:ATP-binding cassette domain-containing protein [Spirochaetaceae bacterium]